MRAIHTLIAAALLAAAPAVCQSAADSEAAAKLDPEALEQQMEEARRQLDEAARKLASLHSEMWDIETTGARSNDPMIGILLGDMTRAGLMLAGVTPGGGGEEAGLKAGDLIVELNGVRFDQGRERSLKDLLHEAMDSVSAGDSVHVRYVRDGTTHEVDVVTQPRGRFMATVVQEKAGWLKELESLGDLEDLEALQGLENLDVLVDGALDQSGLVQVPAGLRLDDVTGDLAGYFDVDEGVVVLAVPDRATGLAAGDVLLTIDGEAVEKAESALTRLGELEGTCPVEVKRRGRRQNVDVDCDALNAERSVQLLSGNRRVLIHVMGDDGDRENVEITVND